MANNNFNVEVQMVGRVIPTRDLLETGRTFIDLIAGNLTRTSIGSLYIPFAGEQLQYIVNNEIKSFCYLNVQDFFPDGMYKIGDDNDLFDSIKRNNDDEIIYTKNIKRISLADLTFTLGENHIFSSSVITDAKLNRSILIDYYTVTSDDLTNGYAKIDSQQIKICDTNYDSEASFKEHIKNGYVYYVLNTPIEKKISPNPDLTFLIEDATGEMQITSFLSDSAPLVGTFRYGEDPFIKYATSKDLQFVYDAVDNNIEDLNESLINTINTLDAANVKSVNEILPVNGNVTINRIASAETADIAIDLKSDDTFLQKDTFLFRTSGGSDNIQTGYATLKTIAGNAYITDYKPAEGSVSTNSGDEGAPTSTASAFNALTFTDYIEDQSVTNPNGTYTFTFNNDGWTLTFDKDVSFNARLTTQQIQTFFTLNVNAGSYNGCIVYLNYTAPQYSEYLSTRLTGFKSIGFNLYDKINNVAHVKGGDTDYRLNILYNSEHNYTFRFKAQLSDTGSIIQFQNYTLGTTTYPHTFIPPTDGYIVIDNLNGTVASDVMINLIWSGKRLGDETYYAYKEDTISLLDTVTTPGVSSPLILNYVNGSADTLDLVNNKLIRRVGKYGAGASIEWCFKTTVYINTGSELYVDFRTLDTTARNRVAAYNQTHETPLVIPTGNYNEIDFTITEAYDVDDFGIEEFISSYNVNYGSSQIEHSITPAQFAATAPTVEVLYLSNLIDKLRRSVVTYSLQQGISEQSQYNAQQNLGLIQVDCYVGKHQVEVIASNSKNNTILRATKTNDNDTTVHFVLPFLASWQFTATINGVQVQTNLDVQYFGNYNVRLTGKQYGFRRSKIESDPEQRITYILDAEGFNPVSFNDNRFDAGSWAKFINEVAAPVLLTPQGVVTYLNPDNQNEQIDGTGVSWGDLISNNSQEAMVEFRKYMYVRRTENDYYEEVVFSDEPSDNTFVNYAGITLYDQDKNITKDRFYWGMFEGSTKLHDNVTFPTVESGAVVSTTTSSYKLHSLPTNGFANANAPLSSYENFANNVAWTTVARTTESEGAITTNTLWKSHWHVGYKFGWDYICDLLTLLGKNDDIQTVFGWGIKVQGQAPQNGYAGESTLTSKLNAGPFIKATNVSDAIRVFWIYNFYGNAREPLLGYVRRNYQGASWANTKYYVKTFLDNEEDQYGYLPSTIATNTDTDLTGLGYEKLSLKTQEAAGPSIIKNTYTDKYGTIPISGIAATSQLYITDAFTISSAKNTTAIPLFGCVATQSANILQNGPRGLNFDTAINVSLSTNQTNGTAVWPRLTYV